jgi:UDP-2,4-diacetamido-2,4,6-trideoxy-beta-L-altropyranose hydrolase
MRCLALADELKRRGDHVCFACGDLLDDCSRIITGHGFRTFRLGRGRRGSEPSPKIVQKKDAQAVLKILGDFKADWLVVDSYCLDITWEAMLRPFVGQIMAIDDLADRAHDCDILLDQNFYRDPKTRYDGLVPGHCSKLFGPGYALLRDEFRTRSGKEKAPGRDGVQRILVTFGNADLENMTMQTLKAVEALKQPRIAADVIVGSSNPHREAVEKFCAARPWAVFHFQPSNIAELMTKADIAVGAGGTTSWERCCMGLPSIVFILAENQRRVVEELAESQYVLSLGSPDRSSTGKIRDALAKLIDDPDLRREMRIRSLQLVDGKGARRVAAQMKKLAHKASGRKDLRVRPLRKEDMDDLFHWRNHLDVRKNFFNPQPLARREHEQWFRDIMKNTQAAVYILFNSSGSVGVMRFEEDETRIRASVMLNPSCIGRGCGAETIRLGTERFVLERRPAKKIVAEIKTGNEASKKAFSRAGFREDTVTYQYAVKRGR